MSRTVRLAILALPAVIVLAACSSGNQHTTSSVATPAATVSTAAATTTPLRRGEINDQDKVLLSQLDDYWLSTPRADLIQAGEKSCTMMRENMKLDAIAMLSGGKVENGSVTADAASLNHAATFLHAAATAYCPDQLTGVN